MSQSNKRVTIAMERHLQTLKDGIKMMKRLREERRRIEQEAILVMILVMVFFGLITMGGVLSRMGII